MQKDFIPNVFQFIMNNSRSMSFPEAPFFLYKLDTPEGKVDWQNSIYMNMSVTDLNITYWNYESSVAETGIMLVESI